MLYKKQTYSRSDHDFSVLKTLCGLTFMRHLMTKIFFFSKYFLITLWLMKYKFHIFICFRQILTQVKCLKLTKIIFDIFINECECCRNN